MKRAKIINILSSVIYTDIMDRKSMKENETQALSNKCQIFLGDKLICFFLFL